MSWIVEGREWLMLLAELFICYMLVLEYRYDASKDEKKQKRTKTIKKVTTDPTSGSTVTEESTESVESKGETDAK